MRNLKGGMVLFLGILISSFPNLTCQHAISSNKIVETVSEIHKEIESLKANDTLFIADGVYKHVHLIVKDSGKKNYPIVIQALNRGKVYFTGNVKVEIRGDHIVLDGIYFKDGNRHKAEWSTHGPGLVAIYGSHNRITQCAFHAFDQTNSAYITTSLTEDGKTPQHCRIDHCSFTEKITFDQVINLNNKTKKEAKSGESGIPMYHRIDHCYFANPKKPGNAGGGIRVGYWRNDYGRCLIDHNLFERQDSEPEIITSKSMENVYYNNTFKNCAGTLNFRHGDKQIAINNFFIGTDKLKEYGGMFVWGSEHIIANNYFNLPTTLKSRGNAALYLNCGAIADEHALAFNIKILNNYFDQNNGYAINFSALYERRIKYCADKGLKLEFPRDLLIVNNLFVSQKNSQYPFFYKHDLSDRNIKWEINVAINGIPGFEIGEGIIIKNNVSLSNYLKVYNDFVGSRVALSNANLYSIEGIDMDIPELVAEGLKGSPLTWKEVGPDWLEKIPGTYAKTGKLSHELQIKFNEVIESKR